MHEEELLHNIDKRLAVLEALGEEHAEATSKQLTAITSKLEQMQGEVGKLKVKVAGIAAITGILMSGVGQWLSHIFS